MKNHTACCMAPYVQLHARARTACKLRAKRTNKIGQIF
ncbi:hypothetical protein APS_0911 [Acetobacter pasteurianus subsp. pasteurianus LMG 1262 = NBRC 106471]|nr:hypothetical protein APS_0911 [Acetobacter pasteurianus subsp. pasteurianus LMG 1262 = NBRC 106471]